MKRLIVAALALVFIISACGPRYSVKRDKKGIYRTAELEANILSSDKGDWGDQVYFNLKKYTYGSNKFYTAIVYYIYPEKGFSLNLLGVKLGGSMFGIKSRNGVFLSINGGKPFPLKYKTSPEHKVETSTSYNNGMPSQSTTHFETVELVMTEQWIAYLVKAKSLNLTLCGTDSDPEKEKTKKIEYYFKEENFKIIKQFYDEEIKGRI
jgi:hypothetical protein